jgi:hypothetical protein
MVAFTALLTMTTRSQQEIPKGGDPVPGQPIAMPKSLIGLEIAFGKDTQDRAAWDGEVRVSEGRVLSVDVVQGAPASRADGSRFMVKAKVKAKVAKKKQQAQVTPPVLYVLLDAPRSANLTVDTGAGAFTAPLADLEMGKARPFLEGRVSVERQEASLRLTGRATEDDFPVGVNSADGSSWVAYVEYQPDRARLNQPVAPADFDAALVPKANGDKIRLLRFDGKTWRSPIDVTAGGLDVWRPTVAIDGQGTLWVAWSQQVDGDWEIFYRRYTPGRDGADGRMSEPTRLTRAKGSDFHVVAATDSKGDVWLAWQGFREGSYEIFAVNASKNGPEPRVVSDSKANDWSPAIAADGKGNVYVAWDTYDAGNYDVRVRNIAADSAPVTVANSARFEARPHLVADSAGRLWIAYEEGDEQWGKDFASVQAFRKVGFTKNPGYALYVNRTVRVRCMVDGKVMQPSSEPAVAFGDARQRGKSVPRLVFDADGGLWLFVRQHPLATGQGETWHSYGVRYDGKSWSAPKHLPNSSNLIDNRPALLPSGKGILCVFSGDRRQATQTRDQDDLYALLLTAGSGKAGDPDLVATEPEPTTLETVHPDEPADIKRMREYRLTVDGTTLRPLRGEFHRHTEVSSHTDQDGLLEDSWRYALDAAGHDWMGNGDHDNGFGFEYLWWIIQKMTDLHLNPPWFVPAQTYERSVQYPNGHRNVIMPKRGIRPLPRGDLEGTPDKGAPDTKLLYAYLKHFGGICASHTSATDMGTDWRDNDPDVEPIVEIYQGHRHNYEHFGAPRSPTAQTQIGGYQPAGFIWNAFEKGYRLGFQSSSDHVSTHWSYAIALATEPSREAIIDAFRKRHCYAATDNILLDVRSGGHMMGDIFTSGDRPSLEIKAFGTSPVKRLHVIRNNKYVFSTEPNTREVSLRYSDDDQTLKPGQTYYYYVRVEQADGNLAWASPMWITYKP